jgi:hypothetical protein
VSGRLITKGPIFVQPVTTPNRWQVGRNVYTNGVYLDTEYLCYIRRVKSKAKPGRPMHGKSYFKIDPIEMTLRAPLFPTHAEAVAWLKAVVVLS